MNELRLGIDIGSTTLKAVVMDSNTNEILFQKYIRHNADINRCLDTVIDEIMVAMGDREIALCLTGSIGMGVAEKLKVPFVQEVVAASLFVRKYHPDVAMMIDIGGEDGKMAFFRDGNPEDLRMNGNCAGGTGAFIDQMAALLNVETSELDSLAGHANTVYPIASRCGVFSKTDIQNLIARNVSKEDIAASIFHAVSVQTVTTLARGKDVKPPILMCGGPLTYIPALRKAFADYLGLPESDFIVPENSQLIPAWGCALCDDGLRISLTRLKELACKLDHTDAVIKSNLSPIFSSVEEYGRWMRNKSSLSLKSADLKSGKTKAYIGIDSGSTTTKIVALDEEGSMLFSYYADNNGDPVDAVRTGLNLLLENCRDAGAEMTVCGSCSTGYGEDLIKAAFRMNHGIVETMAHYLAARRIYPDVTFILDIGGQDMKAIFVDDGVINRIEVNEACSSGCGSFISTFADSLGYGIEDFARAACFAPAPCDLGTRCTVFMNSKVKQVLREGTSVDNIAAGLTYSVVRNCLYKVLQLKDPDELGDRIVVQGGTMRNDSVVRAFERLTGKEVGRSDYPELMGAVGCAYHAMESGAGSEISLTDMLDRTDCSTDHLTCRGCQNQCVVTRFRFGNSNVYYSGNRCEKAFSNRGKTSVHGQNAYERKRRLLFGRDTDLPKPLLTVGIPRCLNTFEDYPFWHTLLTECNIAVVLSDESNFTRYEKCVGKVMSDNICIPAKVVHSHIENLTARGVDRIFMPFVIYEKSDDKMQNSYNCPIVSGYSQVIRSVHTSGVPVDSPTFSFKEKRFLYAQCREYLSSLGIDGKTVKGAFEKAMASQERFERNLVSLNASILEEARSDGRLVVMLAGRPYHADTMIQHKVAEMIAAQGASVITDDYVRDKKIQWTGKTEYLSQWSFPNRIFKAAQWAAQQPDDVQFMQLTSFGCGPDAFMIDEVRGILHQGHKNCTVLKIDDVNNIGSLRLRVRSLVESLNIRKRKPVDMDVSMESLPAFTADQRYKTIIVPFFTPFVSPVISDVFALAAYKVESLPMSDSQSEYWGLKYSNNEICYPATLIVGDIIKAFKSGGYDPARTCVAMTQTGGQCRASNYMSLIRKALVENGYTDTPVISVSSGSGLKNNQPGFRINWPKMLPMVVAALLYTDAIARFYYSSVVREMTEGVADCLRDKYLDLAKSAIRENRPERLYELIESAAREFDGICEDKDVPKVGIVGEIFLKYHPFAQKNTTRWLVDNGLEVVYPALSDFFMQGLVNMAETKREYISYRNMPSFMIKFMHDMCRRQIEKVNAAASKFRYFIPFDDIFEKAETARDAISLSARFGEGWMIAGEIGTLAGQGVRHFVSLQPFGCIANHIVQKGIENRLKSLYPRINILTLDFDSSVSEVNISNRLLLFINNITDNGNDREQKHRADHHRGGAPDIHREGI